MENKYNFTTEGMNELSKEELIQWTIKLQTIPLFNATESFRGG